MIRQAGVTEQQTFKATIDNLVASRAELQRELERREAEHERYREEVQHQLRVAVNDIRRRQDELLRKVPQVSE